MDQRFKLACVSSSARLSDAMWALERSHVEISLITDDDGRLIGTMTDGDIRRALLAGASLGSPVLPHMTRDFTATTPEVSRSEVLDLMQARLIDQIPIVDREGKLIGLHRLHDVLGVSARDNWAIVMAGGRGTRLLPLTEAVPKPMIRVAGRPILERIVLHLVSYGIRRVFLSINYLGHVVEAHFGDGAKFGCRIEYLHEAEPLGTAGSLSLLQETPHKPVLVMNGDLVTQVNVGDMLDFHENGAYHVTVGTKRYFHTVPYGCLELDDERVVQVEEKPTLTRWVNAGIYVLDPRVASAVPSHVAIGMPTIIEQALARGERIGAYEIPEDWIDVGQHGQLQHAREGGA